MGADPRQHSDHQKHDPGQVSSPGACERYHCACHTGRCHYFSNTGKGHSGAAFAGGNQQQRCDAEPGDGGQVPGEPQSAPCKRIAAEDLWQVRSAKKPNEDVTLAKIRVDQTKSDGKAGGSKEGLHRTYDTT